MPTKARYLADLLNASGELDSTGAIEAIQDQISSLFAGIHIQVYHSVIMIHLEHLVQQLEQNLFKIQLELCLVPIQRQI